MNIFPQPRLQDFNQSGFALLELLMAVCISAVLAAGIATTMYQFQSTSDAHYCHVVAVQQVENAVHYLIRDVQMAQIVAPQGSQGFPLVLTWISWDSTSSDYKTIVTYSLNPANGTQAQLQKRLQTFDINNNPQKDQTSVIASYMAYSPSSPSETNCSYDPINHKLVLELTSNVSSGSKQDGETRNVEIVPRPGS